MRRIYRLRKISYLDRISDPAWTTSALIVLLLSPIMIPLALLSEILRLASEMLMAIAEMLLAAATILIRDNVEGSRESESLENDHHDEAACL
jgi:hypothetical protein